MSGGERQRLALARALLGGQRAVVLDEPTSHLDGPTATAVLDDLLAATADRAVVLITHGTEAAGVGREHRVVPTTRGPSTWQAVAEGTAADETGTGSASSGPRERPGRTGSAARTTRPRSDRPGVDHGALYAHLRGELLALLRSRPGADLDIAVPATPDWTVHDVVAHLVGITADLNAGRFPSGGEGDWTDAQVAARSRATLDELAAEWEDEAPTFEDGLRLLGEELGRHFVADLVVHATDVRSALGLPSPWDPVALDAALAHYLGAAHERLEAGGRRDAGRHRGRIPLGPGSRTGGGLVDGVPVRGPPGRQRTTQRGPGPVPVMAGRRRGRAPAPRCVPPAGVRPRRPDPGGWLRVGMRCGIRCGRRRPCAVGRPGGPGGTSRRARGTSGDRRPATTSTSCSRHRATASSDRAPVPPRPLKSHTCSMPRSMQSRTTPMAASELVITTTPSRSPGTSARVWWQGWPATGPLVGWTATTS